MKELNVQSSLPHQLQGLGAEAYKGKCMRTRLPGTQEVAFFTGWVTPWSTFQYVKLSQSLLLMLLT